MQPSQRNLQRRINRVLAHRGSYGHRLCKARRGSRLENSVGEWYIIDVSRNEVIYTHMSPVGLGAELGLQERGQNAA